MTNNVGITRTKEGLEKALEKIATIKQKLKNNITVQSRLRFELNNALCCAQLVASAALKRDSSIGSHYRADTNMVTDNNTEKESIQQNDKLLSK